MTNEEKIQQEDYAKLRYISDYVNACKQSKIYKIVLISFKIKNDKEYAICRVAYYNGSTAIIDISRSDLNFKYSNKIVDMHDFSTPTQDEYNMKINEWKEEAELLYHSESNPDIMIKRLYISVGFIVFILIMKVLIFS